jgi:uncharacterized protein YggE
MAAARQQAVAAARTDAEQLAAAAGEHLVGLLTLTDQPQPSEVIPSGLSRTASSSPASAAAVPVMPGTQQLSVNVTAVWAVSR